MQQAYSPQIAIQITHTLITDYTCCVRICPQDALRTLYVLDALDADGNVTESGHEMSGLPLEPALARCLLAAEEAGVCICFVLALITARCAGFCQIESQA